MKDGSVYAVNLLTMILFKFSIFFMIMMQGAPFHRGVCVTAKSFGVSQGWCTFE